MRVRRYNLTTGAKHGYAQLWVLAKDTRAEDLDEVASIAAEIAALNSP